MQQEVLQMSAALKEDVKAVETSKSICLSATCHVLFEGHNIG